MWASSLPQYCSGPVDGNLYAIVKKTADGDWIEESSAGEDSGCGASSNIGYRPADLSPASSSQPAKQQPPLRPPTPPLRTSIPAAKTAAEPLDRSRDVSDGLDSLLEGLLGVGKTSATAGSTAPEDSGTSAHAAADEPETERERQLAAELARTRQEIQRQMRQLVQPSASEATDQRLDDCIGVDVDENEGHRRQPSFASNREDGGFSSHEHDHEHRHKSFTLPHQPHQQHHQQRRHYEHHYEHHYHEQRRQQQQQQAEGHHSQFNNSTHRRPKMGVATDCSNSPKSVYSTPDGDIQIQLGDSTSPFGPNLFSRAPLWERQFRHPQLNSLPRQARRKAPTAAEPDATRTLGPRQGFNDRFGDSRDLSKSRDLLERRLQELQSQMQSARNRVQQQQQQQFPTLQRQPIPHRDELKVETAVAHQYEESTQRNYQEVETITMKPIGRGIHDLGTYSGPNLRAKSANEQKKQQFQLHPDPTPQRLLHSERDRTSNGIPSVSNHSGSTTPRVAASPLKQQPIRIDYQNGPSQDVKSDAQRSQETMHLWYRPGISREETVNLLRSSPPGSFLIRDSNSFPGAFGLAVRADADSNSDAATVRHFLLEPAAGGVRLRGCPSEPTFAGLAPFVAQHSADRMALPCRLRLPPVCRTSIVSSVEDGQGMYDNPDRVAEAAAMSGSTASIGSSLHQGGAAAVYPAAYIGSANVESLASNEAVTRAVSSLLGASPSPNLASTDCQIRIGPEAVILMDQQRKQFFRKHFPMPAILYCGFDGLNRRLENGRALFGLVVRGSRGENSCIILSESEDSAQHVSRQQPVSQLIVSLINQAMLSGINGGMR